MAVLSLLPVLSCLFVFFRSGQAGMDPLNDFCRRFGHQTTVVDRRLYIDGGLLNWNPISQNPLNFTNDGLLYNDLNHDGGGMPQLHASLNKSRNVPSVTGGMLWRDSVNKRLFMFGGEYEYNIPDDFSLWSYDIIHDDWNQTAPPNNPIQRVAFGAGTSVDDRAEGYYLGGWLSNKTSPGYSGPPVATSNLIIYDMLADKWTNNTGPDAVGRAEGVMVYVPASDAGMLIYFGGITTPDDNGTLVGEPMERIHVYDIAGATWYVQKASGEIPAMRRRFCAGAAWAQDKSSYNIYLFGGLGLPPDGIGFDDVYILSLPSFTWIKWYPDAPGPGAPHHSLSCDVIDGTQMLVIGGTFPNTSSCDVPTIWGTHNMNLGKDNPEGAKWSLFNPNITKYKVPSEVIDKIGGSEIGGASIQAPQQGWDDRDLPVLMARKAGVGNRTPTRSIPRSTALGQAGFSLPRSRPPGVIIGASVAGAVLALITGAVIFFFARRYAAARRTQQDPNSPPTSIFGHRRLLPRARAIVELPTTTPQSTPLYYEAMSKQVEAREKPVGRKSHPQRQYWNQGHASSPPVTTRKYSDSSTSSAASYSSTSKSPLVITPEDERDNNYPGSLNPHFAHAVSPASISTPRAARSVDRPQMSLGARSRSGSLSTDKPLPPLYGMNGSPQAGPRRPALSVRTTRDGSF